MTDDLRPPDRDQPPNHDQPPDHDQLSEPVSSESQPADAVSETAAELTTTIARLLREGDYLEAVIFARDRGNLGVRQARTVVEHIAASEGLRVPKSGCASLANVLFVAVALTLIASIVAG